MKELSKQYRISLGVVIIIVFCYLLFYFLNFDIKPSLFTVLLFAISIAFPILEDLAGSTSLVSNIIIKLLIFFGILTGTIILQKKYRFIAIPATYITGILIIPFLIIFTPIVFCFKKQEINIIRFGLYLQHCLGIAGFILIEEWIASKVLRYFFSINISFNSLFDFISIILVVFVSFYIQFKIHVHESLVKTYGGDWKDLSKKGIFTSGLTRYVVDSFHQNNPGFEEGHLKNEKKEGLWKQYDDLGSLECEVNYQNGKKDGLEIIWHENGQLLKEINWRHGKKISEKYWN